MGGGTSAGRERIFGRRSAKKRECVFSDLEKTRLIQKREKSGDFEENCEHVPSAAL